MSRVRILARRWLVWLGVGAVLAIVLSGCAFLPSDPAQPTGVRLNCNGTVDFVSCLPVSNVKKIEGSTYRRDGSETIIDKSKVELTLEGPSVRSLAIGQILHFSGVPKRWNSMYLGATSVGAAVQDTDLRVGNWTWYGYVNPEKCLAGQES